MAKKKNNPFVIGVNIMIVIITIIALFFTIFYIYYKTWGKDKVPTSLTTTYVTTVIDPQTNEEKPFIEVNVMSNAVGNGQEMVEVLFNSYTGTDKQAIIGMGLQYINGKIYYYNRTNDGTGFIPVVDEDEQFNQKEDIFLTDINDQLFAIKIDGSYERGLNFGEWMGAVFGTPVLKWFTGGVPTTITEEYTLEDFMKALERTIVSNSNDTGNGILPLVEMSTYLSIYDATTNEQISNQELGEYGLKSSYFTIQYSYSKSGVNWAKQSLFGSVAGDGDYNNSTVDPNKDYWQATSRVELNIENFEKRTSALDGKDYLYLTPETISKMNLNTAVEVYININLDDTNIGGFDYYALTNLKNIKEIQITSSVEKSFKILNDALLKTGISNEDIVTSNVIIESEVANEMV